MARVAVLEAFELVANWTRQNVEELTIRSEGLVIP